MKKAISYLVTIMMVFTMVPSIAFAGAAEEQQAAGGLISEQTDVTYAGSLNLHIEQSNPIYVGYSEPVIETVDAVSSNENAITPNGSGEATYAATADDAAAILREQMVDRQTTVTINMPVTEADLTETAMNALTTGIFTSAMKHTGKVNEGDSLQWVWKDQWTDISVTGDVSGLIATITYTIEYYTTAEQEAALTAAVEVLKTELALDGKTDYEIVKAVYDYMTANISYDYANYSDDSYVLKWTAYAALVNKTSVCQGYATLFYRMMCEYGIDARLVAGTSLNSQGVQEAHSWNIVKLGGKYYHLDATWDSTWDTDTSKHDYFLKGSDTFTNHTLNSEFTTESFVAAYPMSTTDYVPGAESDDQGGIEDEEPDVPEDEDGEVVGEPSKAEDFEIVVSGENATLTKYKGQESNVVIPANIHGKNITTIGSTAFMGNDSIISVTIPASVTKIENGMLDQEPYPYVVYGAFAGCNNLEEVICVSGSKLQSIGEWAFYGDEKLCKVTLPSSIRVLELSCFEKCTALEELILPEGLTAIRQNALTETGIKELHIPATCTEFNFWNTMNKLESYSVASGSNMYRTYDGVLYESYNGTWRMASYPIAKPEKVYIVADFANYLYTDGLTNIPEDVTLYINECKAEALFDGYEISKIRCTIVPADTNPYYKSAGNFLLSKDGKTLEQIPAGLEGTVVIPKGIEYIADYAGECGNYSEIQLPESIKEIGAAAFWMCDRLEKITIPYGIEKIGAHAFQECTSLSEIVIPEGIEVIDFNTLYYCSNLKSITLPKSLKSIDNQAFAGCDSLVQVNYTGTEEQWDQILIGNINECLLEAQIDFSCEACKEHVWSEIYITEKDASCQETGDGYEYCVICGYKLPVSIPATGHTYGDWIVDVAATCETDGFKHKACTSCGETITETIDALDHNIVKHEAKAATCTEVGWESYEICSRCDHTTYEEIPAIGHAFSEWEVTTRATLDEDGVETKKCANCDATQTQEIARVKGINRSYATLAYNGMKRTPVVVKDVNGKTLVYGVDFRVVYHTNCKNVGAHKFKVVLLGKYEGDKTISFTINPKATSITKVTKPAKKQLKLTWQKRTAQVTGYEIQYSTTSNFTKATTKTLKVKSFKTTAKTIKQLKSKKNYWVKIRTYKTVNGKTYCSAWSKAQKVRTK